MTSDQQNSAFSEPASEELAAIGRRHVMGMELTTAKEVWVSSGMEHLLLTTTGRRSGKIHKVALPFWYDRAGCRVVVASFVGAPQHPAWYLNITDTEKNRTVQVRLREGQYWSAPEIAAGDQYATLWAELTADRPFYADYQARCARKIPLVRLPGDSEPPGNG